MESFLIYSLAKNHKSIVQHKSTSAIAVVSMTTVYLWQKDSKKTAKSVATPSIVHIDPADETCSLAPPPHDLTLSARLLG